MTNVILLFSVFKLNINAINDILVCLFYLRFLVLNLTAMIICKMIFSSVVSEVVVLLLHYVFQYSINVFVLQCFMIFLYHSLFEN